MSDPPDTTLALSSDETAWLTQHLESWIVDKQVNTAPEAHAIVTKLHALASGSSS